MGIDMRVLSKAALLAAGVLIASPGAVAWGAPGDCSSLGGVVEAGDICNVQVSEPSYTVDLKFPLDYPDQQAIIAYLSQAQQGFVNISQTPGARNFPYEMDVSAESFRSAQTRSVVLTLFQNVGGAHPTTWYKSFTYDVNRARPVTFDTLFAPDAQPLDTIFPIVASRLEEETGLVGAVSPGDGRDPANYQNFAVTDDSLIFFFGRAEMLPSYAGATSVELSRSEIPLLAL